jgi:hypothetical protein
VQERHAVWQQVRAHFAGVAKDAAEMQTRARPEAVPSLKRIQQSALAGQAKVDHLIANGGA